MRQWTAKERELVRCWQAEGVPMREQAILLNRTYRSVKKAAERWGFEHDSQPELKRADTEARVIAMVGRGMHQNQMAAEMGLRQGYISKVIKRLVEAGIVERPGPRGQYRISAKWKRMGGRTAELSRHGPNLGNLS